jgi:hypothetical protein
LMSDNLNQIRSNYEKSLADYQADRTKALNTLTTVSFFGGLGLVLLVAMLGLMRIVSGIRLWVAAVGATTCCLIIGAILMDPGRLTTGQNVAVAFSSYQPPRVSIDNLTAPPEFYEDDRPASRTIGANSDRSTRVPVPQQGRQQGASEPSVPSHFIETLYWNPLLIAGPDGKASIGFELPKTAGTFRLAVDAYGDGRIGFGRAEIVSQDTHKPPASP